MHPARPTRRTSRGRYIPLHTQDQLGPAKGVERELVISARPTPRDLAISMIRREAKKRGRVEAWCEPHEVRPGVSSSRLEVQTLGFDLLRHASHARCRCSSTTERCDTRGQPKWAGTRHANGAVSHAPWCRRSQVAIERLMQLEPTACEREVADWLVGCACVREPPRREGRDAHEPQAAA